MFIMVNIPLGVNLNTIENKTQHELNCEGRKAANVFITLDGKAKFLCKVRCFASLLVW